MNRIFGIKAAFYIKTERQPSEDAVRIFKDHLIFLLNINKIYIDRIGRHRKSGAATQKLLFEHDAKTYRDFKTYCTQNPATQIFAISEKAKYDIYHPIPTLPKEIANLVQLRVLDLQYYNLMLLPSDINALTNLEILLLNHNRLDALPDGFDALTNLKILSLSYNSFTRIPSVLKKMTHLEKLDLTKDGCQKFPDWFDELCTTHIMIDKKYKFIYYIPSKNMIFYI